MRTFDRNFWKVLIPFIFFIIVVLFFPFLFTTYSWFNLNFSDTGEIGDTLGGILTPFIALSAAVLTFFAFWVQFKANEQQREDLKKERFENRFYELLRLHKANVNEIKIGEHLQGRKAFVHMFYELRYVYRIYEKISSTADQKKGIDLAYTIFFFGIGFNSQKYYWDDLSENDKITYQEMKDHLLKCQGSFLEFKNLKKPTSNYLAYNINLSDNYTDNTIELYYCPFEGHVSKLSHYYRHIFQTAHYIKDQNFLTDDEKYSYLKTLRAQLSDFEQLLLYYNSLAWFDEEWRELFTKYRLIKNIPIPLADFAISPQNHYSKEIEEFEKKGIKVFEWFKRNNQYA